jgi:hypothetical protein
MDEIGKGCKLWLPALFISSVPANKKQDQPVEGIRSLDMSSVI